MPHLHYVRYSAQDIDESISDHTQLCHLLSHCEEGENALKVKYVAEDGQQTGKIIQYTPCGPLFSSAVPDISLASLIENHHFENVRNGGTFSPGDKAALLRSLAISLLCFSKESWLCKTWRAEDMYFLRMRDTVGDSVKNVDRPYQPINISAYIPEAASNESPWLGNIFILSFALLILEIQRGQRFSTSPNLLTAVDKVFREEKDWLEEDFKKIIQACLSFDQRVSGEGIGATLEEKTIDFIYRKIVKPLEDGLSRWTPPVDGRELKLKNQPTNAIQARSGRRSRRSRSTAQTRALNPSSSPDAIEFRNDKQVRFQDVLEASSSEASDESEASEDSNYAVLFDERDLPADAWYC